MLTPEQQRTTVLVLAALAGVGALVWLYVLFLL
jgi:hypothetical protein